MKLRYDMGTKHTPLFFKMLLHLLLESKDINNFPKNHYPFFHFLETHSLKRKKALLSHFLIYSKSNS